MYDWGVEGGELVTGVYAVAAAPGADSFGLIALRRGRVARTFVAIGTLSVAVLYTASDARGDRRGGRDRHVRRRLCDGCRPGHDHLLAGVGHGVRDRREHGHGHPHRRSG